VLLKFLSSFFNNLYGSQPDQNRYPYLLHSRFDAKMSDTDEKQIPSNSSDISIEEIGPEVEGHEVVKNDDAEELIPPILDDVSVGGRIEEISAGSSQQVKEPVSIL
jgi:hypothetical protein